MSFKNRNSIEYTLTESVTPPMKRISNLQNNNAMEVDLNNIEPMDVPDEEHEGEVKDKDRGDAEHGEGEDGPVAENEDEEGTDENED